MQYKTIVVDPPWPYHQQLAGEHVRGGIKYQVMTIGQIKAIDVLGLADSDCQLWLWTTNAHIHEALHCIDAWKFRYVTMCTWVKRSIGLGYWLRGQTEHVLLAIKGSPRTKLSGPHGATGSHWSTAIITSRTRHSEKPQAFYDMAEAMGEPPRLELFARRFRLGWESMGKEVGSEL